MLDGIQPSSNGSRQPQMDGTFSLYKILNVIGEDDKNNPTVRTLFSTDNVIPLSGPAVSYLRGNPDKPQQIWQNVKILQQRLTSVGAFVSNIGFL